MMPAAPLDWLEIDALLDHVPQGREISQIVHCINQLFRRKIHLLFRCKSANSESGDFLSQFQGHLKTSGFTWVTSAPSRHLSPLRATRTTAPTRPRCMPSRTRARCRAGASGATRPRRRQRTCWECQGSWNLHYRSTPLFQGRLSRVLWTCLKSTVNIDKLSKIKLI